MAEATRPVVIGAGDDVAVVVARAHNLLRAFARSLPRLTRLFTFAELMKPEERRAFLTEAFAGLPTIDLSREPLRATRCSNQRQKVSPWHSATRAPDHTPP
jgi:hypothetical protein